MHRSLRGLLIATALGANGCDELFGLEPIEVPVQPGDLALAYAFDDPAGSASAEDSSGNANTARLFGPVFEPGHYGTALAFDGLDDQAITSNSPSIDIAGTGITITAWIAVVENRDRSDQIIIGKLWQPLGSFAAPYYQYGIEYLVQSNSLVFIFADAAGAEQGPYPMGGVSGTLEHFAFTYDGAVVRGYVGGVELLTAPAAGELSQRDTQLVIGADGIRNQPFHGHVDNVRIYRRALDATEIAADMNVSRADTSSSSPVRSNAEPSRASR